MAKFSNWISSRKGSWILDCFLLLALQVLVLQVLGMLTNPTPLGDDVLVHIQKIIDLSRNFFQFQWDPRSFDGYMPSTGYAWASYGPPAIFVFLGLDPIAVFHATFLVYFLSIGPSAYYFARCVGAHRIVSLAVSVPVWSSVGCWGYIAGGAYSRVFTLPFVFTALALTFRYAQLQNEGRPTRAIYWLLLAVWVLTLLGDVYIAAVPVAIAMLFLILSAGLKNIRLGVFRLAVVLLPVFALTSWFWVPLVAHILGVGSPPSESIVNLASQLFWAGPVLSAVSVFLRRKSSASPLKPEYLAILFSLNAVSVYFLIMGAITPIWSYIPRVWATYDSLNILTFLLPAVVACLFFRLRPLPGRTFRRYREVLLIILVAVNAFGTISLWSIPDRNPLNNTLDQTLSGSLAPLPAYRVSLQGRTLTRMFPYYYSDSYQTGGRVLGLDLDPFYRSWYDTDVFYKDDLATLNSVYLEDQPTINVTGLVGGPQNFASTMFWLDWYGVGALVLEPGFYPVQNTAGNFSARQALFSTKTAVTQYGTLVFVQPIKASPTLVATNASVIGFYSRQSDSKVEYNDILALLSYLGLDSRYVVPIYLTSLDNINVQDLNGVITDQYSYSAVSARLSSFQAQGTKVFVLPNGLLSDLQLQGTVGAKGLIDAILPAISRQTQNLMAVSSFPAQTVAISPQEWNSTFSENAQGILQPDQNNLTITINIPDPSMTSQFDIGIGLANPAVLWDQLESRLEVRTSVQSTIGLVFTSSNFTGNYVSHDSNVGPNQWTSLQYPFSNFAKWNFPDSKFATATGFTLSITIPPGHSNATVQFSAVSITEPGYTDHRFLGAVPLSAAGFLEKPQGAGILLSNELGSLEGTYSASPGESSDRIVPLQSFTTQANGTFTRVLSVGIAPSEPSTLTTFPEPGWTLVKHEWTTNQTLSVQAVPEGFHGLIWKETYTKHWDISGRDQVGRMSSIAYFLAGPGLVYVPLHGKSVVSLDIAYNDVLYGFFLPLVSILSLAPLVVFRKKIYSIGFIGQRTS